MFRRILGFIRRNEGQDLSEYCLLTALLALIALGIFWHFSGGMQALWSNGNTTLASAGNAAGPAAGTGSSTAATPGSAQPPSDDHKTQ